jgi:hypothetical protein
MLSTGYEQSDEGDMNVSRYINGLQYDIDDDISMLII